MENAIEYLDFEVRIATDETRQSPGLLTGTLLAYGDTGDRRERFDPGALHWPERGIVVNAMHERKASIVLIQPYVEDNEVRFSAKLPNTQAARDAAENVRTGVWPGASIEFRSERENRQGGFRVIQRALLGAAALVDVPSFTRSMVEMRAGRGLGTVRPWSVFTWL